MFSLFFSIRVYVFVFWSIELKDASKLSTIHFEVVEEVFCCVLNFTSYDNRKFIIQIQLYANVIKLEAFLCHLTDITQNLLYDDEFMGGRKIKLDSKQVLPRQ